MIVRHPYFLQAIEDLGRARSSLHAYLVLLRADLEAGRAEGWDKQTLDALYAVLLLEEGAFRVIKHVQSPTKRSPQSNLVLGEEYIEQAMKALPR